MALNINFNAPFWADSSCLRWFDLWMVWPQITLPYSNFEQINDLYICIARYKMSLLYDLMIHFVVLWSIYGEKERSSSRIIPKTLWLETLFSGVPSMVKDINGEAGIFCYKIALYVVLSLFKEICHLRHQLWRLTNASWISIRVW